MKKGLLFFTMVLFLASCEEVPVTLPEFTLPATNKVVLVEELTGASCPNCPAGSEALASLIELYDGAVIGVAIHGELLAEPLTTSKYDFRSELANDLENYLKPYFGKPAAVVNRVQQEGQTEFANSAVALWAQFVENELNKEQTLSLDMVIKYNEDTRQLDINAAVIPLQDIIGDIRISVMITESHIIDAQKNQGEIIEDYEHNHMVRHMLTAFDGDGLTSSMKKDEIINKSFSWEIPTSSDGLWIPENMEVVLFVSNVTPDSKEILQAIEGHVL